MLPGNSNVQKLHRDGVFFIGSWLEVTVENVSLHHEVGVRNE